MGEETPLFILEGAQAAEYFKKIYTIIHLLKKFAVDDELVMLNSTTICTVGANLHSGYMTGFKKIQDDSELFNEDMQTRCIINVSTFLEGHSYHKLNCTEIKFYSDSISIGGFPKKRASKDEPVDDTQPSTLFFSHDLTSLKKFERVENKYFDVMESLEAADNLFESDTYEDSSLFSVFVENPSANTLSISILDSGFKLTEDVDVDNDDILTNLIISEKQLINSKKGFEHQIRLGNNLLDISSIKDNICHIEQVFRIVPL